MEEVNKKIQKGFDRYLRLSLGRSVYEFTSKKVNVCKDCFYAGFDKCQHCKGGIPNA